MQALISDFITISLAYRRDSYRQRNRTRSLAAILVFAALCSFYAAPVLHAQSLYTDPAGAFTVTVPANWQIQRDPGSPMVSFTNEKYLTSMSMGVIHGNAATTPTADKELEVVQSQFPGNCPQAKVQKRGRATLSGISGAFLLVNCTNSKGGLEVMKFAVASKPGMLVVFNSASPAANYQAMLPAFNSMEHSFKLLASAAAVPPARAEGRPVDAHPSTPAQSSSQLYRDPYGRYSLSLPDAWRAEPQASSGALQLSSGPSWAMLVTGGGSDPRDVNHQLTQQIHAQFTDFQMLNEGDFQINGHASHGTNATGMNPKGERVSILVLSINAGNGHMLSMISSTPNDQAKAINATLMQIAQSIRFGGK